MADNFDIVIIGAGIAGLSAAKVIANQSSFSIAVVERISVGSNITSPLTFSDIIKEHDLDDCTKGKYSHFTFHNHNGSSIRYEFEGTPLVVLDYQKACNKIYNSIQNKVSLINKKAMNYIQNDDSVTLELDDEKQIKSKILIDCSGKSKFTYSKINKNHLSYYSHVLGATICDINNYAKKECCFLWPDKNFGLGGGWYYYLDNGKISFGYAEISKSTNYDNDKLMDNFKNALKKFSPYSGYLEGSKIELYERGVIPITFIESFVHNNILIAGDAAGMATNWTCMGIEPALEYGNLAGYTSVKALESNNIKSLKEFQNIWDKENRDTYATMNKMAPRFWVTDKYFWEWIIKNDFAFLTSAQALDRMRWNKHLPGKTKLLVMALKYKLKSLRDKSTLDPIHISIK